MNKQLSELVKRAEAWPQEAQDELVKLGLEIEAWQGDEYRADPDELKAIDEAEASGIVSQAEVDAALAKFRHG